MDINGMVWRAAAAAASVPGPTTSTTPGPTTGQEDRTGDQQQFEESLRGPSRDAGIRAESPPPVPDVAAIHKVDSADMDSATGPSVSLGDEILKSVEQAHEAYEGNLDRINREVGGPGTETMSVSRLMQLQFDVIKFGLDQDLTTKIADKATQGIETVLKNQG